MPPMTGASSQDTMVGGDDPRAAVWQAIRGAWQFATLHAMAELELADHLAGGPLTATELAGRCGAHQGPLVRLLRTLTSMGFVTADGGTYALTERGATLRADAPGTTRWPILSVGAPWSWTAIIELAEAVRTGRSPVSIRYGNSYDYLAENPEQARIFDAYMASRAQRAAASLVSHHDFSGIGTVADIGGGTGVMLAAVLGANPGLRGLLLDREHVTERAREYVTRQGLIDRCEVVTGDYFASVPEGADVYILASILHNHGHDDAVAILRTVRAAMHAGSRLLVIDTVLPSDHRPHFGFELDMRMMSIFNEGRERDETEFATVIEQAGLRIASRRALPSTVLSVIETTHMAPPVSPGLSRM